jgi:hypothetical protein
MTSILIWIQKWFLLQCNDAWEHSYGIKIDTLDNPGWTVMIDLVGTSLENKTLNRISIDRAEDDWINCFAADNKYRGFGGPQNLIEILTTFKNWTESNGG